MQQFDDITVIMNGKERVEKMVQAIKAIADEEYHRMIGEIAIYTTNDIARIARICEVVDQEAAIIGDGTNDL